MCKTCIYRQKIAVDNREKLGEHECHELEKGAAGCAGSVIKGKLVDINTPKHLEEKWMNMMRASWWKEAVETTIRNRGGIR